MVCNMWQEMGLLFDSGELNDQERRTFDDHLTQCPECRNELDAYRHERESFYTPAVLEEAPSAACDAEILRVCSDARKRVATFQMFPAFLRKSVVAVGLLLFGFSVVVFVQVRLNTPSGVAAARQTTISAPASTMIAGTTPAQQKDSTIDSASQENPVNFANTRGNLDLKGVYPVDLQNK